MSQDDSANSARIPISLFTISAILLAAANRTTLNDEVQTVNRVTSNLITRDGATSNLTPRDEAALKSTAMGNGVTSNLITRDGEAKKKRVTLTDSPDSQDSPDSPDSPDSQDSQPFPSIDDTSDRKLQEIYNVINKSDTFENLQQKLEPYGINITSKNISINIA